MAIRTHSAHYRIVSIAYDPDHGTQQVSVKQRRYVLDNEDIIPAPFPPLLAAREISDTLPQPVQVTRSKVNPIPGYRRLLCCMQSLTASGNPVERTVVVPYRPGATEFKPCLREILASPRVGNGQYRGESHDTDLRRWYP